MGIWRTSIERASKAKLSGSAGQTVPVQPLPVPARIPGLLGHAWSPQVGSMATREQKFRQAAFVYLHVGILYEAAVYVAWRNGVLPAMRGPVWVWLLVGAAIVAVIFWALWRLQNAWIARAVWALHALRLPALIEGTFFADAAQRLPPSFYGVALAVVLLNLAVLARAGWDL